MHLFLRKILLFSLIVLALIAAAEAYVRSIPNPARYKHQWMRAHSTEVETLILGSSHCFYGINPNMLGTGKAFSLAQPTQPYRYDWYELTHYPMPHLKTVVLPFSYQSLFEDLESVPRLRYWAVRYRLYMDCDIHSPFSVYGLECLPPASFREKLTSLWRPAQLKWDSLGFGTSYGTTSLLATGHDNGIQRVRENTYVWEDTGDKVGSSNFKSQSSNFKSQSLIFNTAMLDSIAGWCERHSVRLLLVTTPVCASFRANCSHRQMSITDSTLRQILHRHPTVSYHDYWDDTDFHPADFYDADHLNSLGAAKLTRKIIADFPSVFSAHNSK